MAGINNQDEPEHAQYLVCARLALHGEWGTRDDLLHEGTSAPQSTQHRTQCPYRDHSDEHEDGWQEFLDG